MEVEVRPEPTDDEREALLTALDEGPAGPAESAWRRAALDESVEESSP